MKIIIFCGPTISASESKHMIHADFRPPAKHGDIISCVYNDRPDVIVLFDGVFIQDLTVWHSELNEAMNQGVTVYGASALGAIRAAEMESWGMRGVGNVFALFRDGIVESDDEVFCDYDFVQGQYIQRTLPIVNLRYILADAEKASLITQKQSRSILETAKAMFYKERTLDSILNACRAHGDLTDRDAETLSGFIRQSTRNIQKEDAIECLEALNNLAASDLETTRKNYQYDLFFEALFERDRGTKHGETYHPFYYIANDYILYGSDVEAVNDAALNRKLCTLIADHFNVDATGDEIAAEKKLFIQKHDLAEDGNYLSWLKDNDLAEHEFDELLAERVKIEKLQEWYRTRLGFAKNTRYLLEELKLNNQYVPWKQKSLGIHEALGHRRDEIRKTYSENDINTLTALFLKHNDRPWAHAPYRFVKKAGLSPSSFKYLLARDKTLSDSIAREMFQDA